MIAGLPKARSLCLVLVVALLSAGVMVSAQEMQTPSLLPIDPVEPPIVQTPSVTLDGIIAAIDLNPAATVDQRNALLDALGPVVEQEVLTEDQALEILSVIGWASLEDTERIDEAIEAVTTVSLQLLSGTLLGDPVAELADLWAEALTPDGIINSIDKAADRAGLDETTSDPVLDEVERLIVAGFPPGIVLRVVKDALRDGDDPLAALAALEVAAEEGSNGQAANAVTGNGQNRYEETEENANQEPNEEPEAEDNNHGQGRNGEKQDEEPDPEGDDEPEDEKPSEDDESETEDDGKTNNGKKKGK